MSEYNFDSEPNCLTRRREPLECYCMIYDARNRFQGLFHSETPMTRKQWQECADRADQRWQELSKYASRPAFVDPDEWHYFTLGMIPLMISQNIKLEKPISHVRASSVSLPETTEDEIGYYQHRVLVAEPRPSTSAAS